MTSLISSHVKIPNLSSHVKISCFYSKRNLVIHWRQANLLGLLTRERNETQNEIM